MNTASRKSPDDIAKIPSGNMTLRAVAKVLERSAYRIMKLIGEGEIQAESVHNAAGGKTLQVKGESVKAYLTRQLTQ